MSYRQYTDEQFFVYVLWLIFSFQITQYKASDPPKTTKLGPNKVETLAEKKIKNTRKHGEGYCKTEKHYSLKVSFVGPKNVETLTEKKIKKHTMRWKHREVS